MNLRSCAGLLAVKSALVLLAHADMARAQCDRPFSQTLGNVFWSLKDSVSACPAADSVVAGHPCKLRVLINYSDAGGCAKVGVPPESIWVVTTSRTGTLRVNDEGAKIFADDSTDGGGWARVTIPSFSGNGRVTFRVQVSGVDEGGKIATVRTTDQTADGRVNHDDWICSSCVGDLNYDGAVDNTDFQLVLNHATPLHWHRNALFGTPVRRTTTSATGNQGTFNTIGDDFAWSPNGRMLTVTIFDTVGNCAVNLIPADPSVGNGTIPFSMPPHVVLGHPTNHDYSPQWSPLGTTIFWNRGDYYMMYKGVYGQNSDTTTYTVPIAGSLYTMTDMSLSPDGTTLLFSGFHLGEPLHLFTVPIAGGTPVQLTSTSSPPQHFPQWSPDGSLVVYQQDDVSGTHVYQVSAGGGSPQLVYGNDVASAPFFSADGAILLFAKGSTSLVTATLDANLWGSGAQPVLNYPDYTNASNSIYAEQKISPDGTRLALRAAPPGHNSENAQVWAVRRNMSLPPQLTAFGGQSFADTTTAIPISVLEGYNWSGSLTAVDAEGDPLTYAAAAPDLVLGMGFSPANAQFSWTPPAGTAGKTFNVKLSVVTPSGGSDSFIAQFTVHHPTSPMAAQRRVPGIRMVSPNPVRERFEILGDFGSAGASLDIFDVEGRRVARVTSDSPGRLSWDLRSDAGLHVSPGLYLYRASTAGREAHGKIVIAR